MSGVPRNDKNIALLASRYSANCFSLQIAVASENLGNLELGKQVLLQRVNFFCDEKQITFELSSGMIVSNVEILALSTVICSSEMIV